MFVESNIRQKGRPGWVEVICGSMFSGKTEELIRRIHRALLAQQQVCVFKPELDRRYSVHDVVSHDKNKLNALPVTKSNDILELAKNAEVIGIDEGQFFDTGIVNVIVELANQGKRVIVAGLDMDFSGRPFKPMDRVMAIAEYITKVHAICMDCGNLASFSHRRTKSKKTIVLGEKDVYEALCRKCFYEKLEK